MSWTSSKKKAEIKIKLSVKEGNRNSGKVLSTSIKRKLTCTYKTQQINSFV